LVFGGSQGARSINKAMVAALPALVAAYPGLHVIHQTGERDFEDIVAAYRTYWPTRRIEAEVVPFLYDMPRAFRQADLIVSRSGATTVAELTACGKPAILIPFPHAIYGHQERNARVLERAGAARVILDDGLTGDALAHTIQSLLADPARLAEMRRNSKALGRADSAEQVVAACRELVQDVKRST
jgi:UDP-N-acetylglucosamine--N-acetylmuramyl-(pentapeptide) pyrophosphoryl-undecaprenol N-acetylglucosamine transferase